MGSDKVNDEVSASSTWIHFFERRKNLTKLLSSFGCLYRLLQLSVSLSLLLLATCC
jgi:hypothetical protein